MFKKPDMQDAFSEVIYNDCIQGVYWKIGLKTGWGSYIPGQFVMVDVPETFLRRPFSIARLRKGVIEICYKVVGQGTEKLTSFKAGDKIWVLGPLGNGFKVQGPGDKSLLVAGGYGIAPMMGLAEKLSGEMHLFYGTRSRDHLLYIEDFKKLGVHLHISTEDGSYGEKGLVTGILERHLESRVYACGPNKMLHAIIQMIGKRQISCQISLESHMACGVGTCMGCVVKGANGEYIRVCKEGPVFDYKSISL